MKSHLIFHTANEAELLSKINRDDYIEWLVEDRLKEINEGIENAIECGFTEYIYNTDFDPDGMVMKPVKEEIESMGYTFEYLGKNQLARKYDYEEKYKISWKFLT